MDYFDIVLVDFPDGPRHGATPAEAVAHAFKIDIALAEQMVAELPAIVRRRATRLEAKKYYNALTYVGGTVRFETSQPVLDPPDDVTPFTVKDPDGTPGYQGGPVREMTPFSTLAVPEARQTASHNPPEAGPLRIEPNVAEGPRPERVSRGERPQATAVAPATRSPSASPGPSRRSPTNPADLPFAPPRPSQRPFANPMAAADTVPPLEDDDPFADPFAPDPSLLSGGDSQDLFGAPLATDTDDDLLDFGTTASQPTAELSLPGDLDLSLPPNFEHGEPAELDLAMPSELDISLPDDFGQEPSEDGPLDLPTLTPNMVAAAHAIGGLEGWGEGPPAAPAEGPTPSPRGVDFALEPRGRAETISPGSRMQPQPMRAIPSAPAPSISPRARAPQAVASPGPRRTPDRAPELAVAASTQQGFYASIPACFTMPFSAEGLKWLFAITLVVIFMGFVALFSIFTPIMGLVLMFAIGSTLLALSAKFFEASAWATANGSDTPNTFPDLTDVVTDLLVPGYVLAIFGGILFVLPQVIFGGSSPFFSLLLLFVPFLYWPMGLALCARDGGFLPIFNVVGVIVTIARVPLKYLTVIGVGFVAALVPVLAGGLMMASGTKSGLILGLGLSSIPFGYAHGVLGAMMGTLVRTEPEAFGLR